MPQNTVFIQNISIEFYPKICVKSTFASKLNGYLIRYQITIWALPVLCALCMYTYTYTCSISLHTSVQNSKRDALDRISNNNGFATLLSRSTNTQSEKKLNVLKLHNTKCNNDNDNINRRNVAHTHTHTHHTWTNCIEIPILCWSCKWILYYI